jgi:apolipoprotein N-acyltransferase
MKDLPAWLRALAAFASGAVLQFVSPPYSVDWLHWFSFVPFLLVLEDGHRRRNFWLGYLCGFSGVFFLFRWLADTIDIFSNIPYVLACGVVALFAAVWGLPYGALAMAPSFLRRAFPRAWVVAFPALWVTAEYLQPALFPYYQGVGQYRNRYTWQLASVIGAMGVTYLVLLTNCAIADALLRARERRPQSLRVLGAAALTFAGNLGYGYARFHHVERDLAGAPTQRVAILQQHITMVTRLEQRGKEVLKGWMKLTEHVLDQRPDLVAWPEGSISYNPNQPPLDAMLGKLAQENGFDLLVGGGTHTADPEDPERRANWNSAYLFTKDGKLAGRYDKMVPLPFGEYLPWPLGFLKGKITGIGDFRAGTTPTIFQATSHSFTTPICYEAILEGQMRRLSDADFFLNITNDAWFGDTAAPHQHAMLSAVHAMELGRPMLRIAYTGVSMIVEPHGVIAYETRPYTDVAEVREMRLLSVETPYRTWGRWFPHACTLAAAGALFLARRVTRAASSA